ncbi:MAG: gliding motility protein GldN [Prolixibacteraceae bacterium]|jgi:gliding motility associated protien GldN|nr:gliding motility protein GldN [Prolixibacteraceae bacterium]
MKAIIKITILLMLPVVLNAQEGVRFTEKYGPFYDAHEQQNDFTNRKYVKYPFVREADVMWSEVTWEIIDLREKMNLPLYYPTDTIHGRKSLINTIMSGIENNHYTAFRVPINNNEFEFDPNNIILNVDEIRDIGSRQEIIPITIRPGVTRDSLVTIRWRPEEIKQILIKEVWYFDKKNSKLQSEIIGICPIREYTFNGTQRRQRMFWVYYPDARPYLSTVPVYNLIDSNASNSFDDIFVYRYFRSYFVQEANVYNDRMITDYVIGYEAQLESERIKQEIFNKEQDLWEN